MTEVAPHRVGRPSPLALHLGAAAFGYAQAILLAPTLGQDSFPWHPDMDFRANAPATDLPGEAILEEAQDRLGEMLAGIEAWQHHPYRRKEPDRPVIWANGSSRLIDYGGEGPPVLVLPSLINRAYVLDLLPERSMLGYLSAAGLHPYLLDWGAPTEPERGFDLDAYYSRRVLPALAATFVHSGQTPSVLGYCMGGTLAAGLASQSIDLASIVTIGAPWSFARSQGVSGQLRTASQMFGVSRVEKSLQDIADIFGFIPVDLLQSLFALINPIQSAQKFRRFSKMDQGGEDARLFVALEDWLSEGVPLAGPLALDVLINWQLRDTAASGQWKLLGQRVDLQNIALPSLVISGARDTIVQPEQALPLAQSIPGARNLHVDMGHVSMITGSRAEKNVWQPIVKFITEQT